MQSAAGQRGRGGRQATRRPGFRRIHSEDRRRPDRGHCHHCRIGLAHAPHGQARRRDGGPDQERELSVARHPRKTAGGESVRGAVPDRRHAQHHLADCTPAASHRHRARSRSRPQTGVPGSSFSLQTWLINMSRRLLLAIALLLGLASGVAQAAPGLDAISVTSNPGGGQTYTLSIQIVLLMTFLTLLPAGLLMMTAFTRIIIVLALLRQALGTQQTPTNQTLIGLALFLTFFVMAPVWDTIHESAVTPYLDEKISLEDAIFKAKEPIATFMLNQTRDSDLQLFLDMAGKSQVGDKEEVPFSALVPAFITSEIKTAFQIGFMIFIPFLIIDLIIASVLMAMGMMMLSPLIISLPFKIMLFVLVDGWVLIIGTLAISFYT